MHDTMNILCILGHHGAIELGFIVVVVVVIIITIIIIIIIIIIISQFEVDIRPHVTELRRFCC